MDRHIKPPDPVDAASGCQILSQERISWRLWLAESAGRGGPGDCLPWSVAAAGIAASTPGTKCLLQYAFGDALCPVQLQVRAVDHSTLENGKILIDLLSVDDF